MRKGEDKGKEAYRIEISGSFVSGRDQAKRTHNLQKGKR